MSAFTATAKIEKITPATRRGVLLTGVRFQAQKEADSVVIAITGIHGNFYSNPFYYNLGDTLNRAGIDFIYAQTNDAFGKMETLNVQTQKKEIIGSYNERFAYTEEDIETYLDFAQKAGYQHIYLAGHSLGANKVLYYLSQHPHSSVERFILLSPANLAYMMSGVTTREKQAIYQQVENGGENEPLPFLFMGWVECLAGTAYDWEFSGYLDVAHTEKDGDFSVAEQVDYRGALLIGTYDNFTDGDPAAYLQNLNRHLPHAKDNNLLYIPRTGHTYQAKEQEMADAVTQTIQTWQRQEKIGAIAH